MLNKNQKKFANLVLRGVPQRQAYKQVYDCTTDNLDCLASHLASKPEVKEYMETMKEKIMEKELYSMEQYLEEMKQARDIALAKEDAKTMAYCSNSVAETTGLKNKKVQLETNAPISISILGISDNGNEED
jgi:hypothetical protein